MKRKLPDTDVYRRRAEVFKALSHPTRLVILDALNSRKHCVSEFVEMVPGTQANTSKHLEVLRRAGIVTRRRQGSKMMYELALPCSGSPMPCLSGALRCSADPRQCGHITRKRPASGARRKSRAG